VLWDGLCARVDQQAMQKYSEDSRDCQMLGPGIVTGRPVND